VQSQSIEYDIDNIKENKNPNQPHRGSSDFHSTQSTQLPPSAHEPSFPQSSHGPPSLPTDYGPPSLSNENPQYPSDYGIPSLPSSYGLPPTSHERLPSSYGPPPSSYGHSFSPPSNYHSSNYPHLGLIPPTRNTGEYYQYLSIHLFNFFFIYSVLMGGTFHKNLTFQSPTIIK